MRKSDVINQLSRKLGLKSYLEICTPTTGGRFAQIDSGQFAIKHRLIYRCVEDLSDKSDDTVSTSASFSYEIVRNRLLERMPGALYDVVFVDSFHTYEATMADLFGAYALTKRGGLIVVHDCNPTDRALTSPDFKTGSWLGVTYEAFIDFVIARQDADWYTVDCDYGCGVLLKPTEGSKEQDVLALEWFIAKLEGRTYEFLHDNRSTLLRLTSVERFIASVR